MASRTQSTSEQAGVNRAALIFAISAVERWNLLRELASGEGRMVNDLARRIGRSQNATTKHLQVLAKAGIVRKKYRLHELVERFRPAPGSLEIDFGYCVLRLDR